MRLNALGRCSSREVCLHGRYTIIPAYALPRSVRVGANFALNASDVRDFLLPNCAHGRHGGKNVRNACVIVGRKPCASQRSLLGDVVPPFWERIIMIIQDFGPGGAIGRI